MEKKRQAETAGEVIIVSEAVTYFAFALLFMRALTLKITVDKPLVSLDRSWPWVPLPDLGLPNALYLSLVFLCLGISFVLMVRGLGVRRLDRVERTIGSFSMVFYPAVVASFVVNWLTGLGSVREAYPSLVCVFFGGGTVFCFALALYPLRRLAEWVWLVQPTRRLGGKLHDVRDLFQCCLSPLSRLALLRGITRKARGRSCLDCGYFAKYIWPAELPEPRQYDEVGNDVRQTLQRGETPDAVLDSRCLRHVWHYDRTGDRAQQVAAIRRPRLCTKFYPYTQGLPSEHVESHRSRTNRRWLVAGGLLGPYVATAAGFIVSELPKSDGLPVALIFGAICGLVGLAMVAFVINITLNRT